MLGSNSSRKLLLGSAFAVAIAAVTLFPQPSGASDPERVFPEVQIGANAEHFTLGNGLQVVVIPDKRAPVVTHMVWYKAGSADEPRGASGIAHYLEHLMFKGTKTFPGGEFSRVIASVGGQENAFTSYDYTGYFQRVAKEHLKTMMVYESDRMTNLALTQDAIDAELQVVLEERAQRTDNDPGSQLSETMASVLFAYSPYGIPIIGWENEIRTLDVDDALDFYNRFYTPNNAVLVVAGDVTADEVRDLTAETWAKVPRRFETEPRVRQAQPAFFGDREITYSNPRVRQASVRRAWVVPSDNTAEDGDSEALDVLAMILGSGATSRIYQSLVVDQKLATYAGGWYGGSSLGDTRFMVYGAPTDGNSNEDILDAIGAEIDKLIEEGVTDQEMRLAKKSLISQAFFAQDSQSSLARIFGAALSVGSTVEKVQTWPSRIEAVTKDQVVAVARKYLRSADQSVTGYLLPKSAEEES
ncbi:MAG: pitrilysin family protein [Pseudomonadota bacterium]